MNLIFFRFSKNTTWSYNCWGLTVRFPWNNGMVFQFAYFLKKVFAVSISMPSPFHAYNFDLSSQNNNFLHCFLIVLFIFRQLNKNFKSNWIALYRCQPASMVRIHGHSFLCNLFNGGGTINTLDYCTHFAIMHANYGKQNADEMFWVLNHL